MLKKILLIVFIFAIVFLAWRLDAFSYLNFAFLKLHLLELEVIFNQNPLSFCAVYATAYIFITAISFPGGATLLTLLAGAVMGYFPALILVSFCSTIGATCAFLASRFLLRDLFEKKFKSQALAAKDEVQKNGVFYLLTLRILPIFPFFIVNILMGLTAIKTRTFFWVSQLGMLPGTAVFVFAGKSLSQINSPREILTPKMFLVFMLLGLFPMLAKFVLNKIKMFKLYRHYKKPKKFDYNTIVIGAGSGGLVSALITSALKARVALIEKDKMGGDCLNTGCIPSKALLEAAKYSSMTKMPLDFKSVMGRVKKAMEDVAPHDSVERYTSLGVECITGKAHILSPYEVKVNGKTLTAQNLIIATGARPRTPDIAGLDKIKFLTSENLWNITELPKKFLILGGGPIGCEMAQAFQRLGSVVSLIEGGKELLSKEDSDISAVVENKLRSEGVQLHLYSTAHRFYVEDNKKFLEIESLGKLIAIEFDEVLIAAGRTPNVKGFGLEELGIEINKTGTIKTDPFMQTNFPNIYACGDVAGPYQLTHMAGYQAWFAAVNSLFGKWKKFSVNYSSVSWCTFTDPEVATVGQTEKMLKEKEMEYEVTIFPFHELDRSIVDQHTEGFIKVMTVKNSDKILGASIVGNQASLLILEFISAIKFKRGMRSILNTIHPYPTLGEANKYAAGVWQKNHAPKLVLKYLEKFFRWTRG
jgi:pyruvate/2-oxoglutarate dehydrogenase complex dihydrolipoamide dehydrogenase (E3) component/uncharacterized membrane protein YdjX (TVP38/TMEM64 family)